jgi:hypothetical protein
MPFPHQITVRSPTQRTETSGQPPHPADAAYVTDWSLPPGDERRAGDPDTTYDPVPSDTTQQGAE